MKELCKDPWDADYIDKIGEERQALFDLVLAANYMDITVGTGGSARCLLHALTGPSATCRSSLTVMCARVASLSTTPI